MRDNDSLPRKILIVRPTALGDVARTVPALVSLRHAFPDARIDWLVSDVFVDVIRHHPALSGVVAFPRRRFGRIFRDPSVVGEFWSWARGLRRAGYEWVLDFQGLLRSGVFTWITGARKRIGFANAREGAWLAYNRRHFVDPRLHAVDRVLRLLESQGVPSIADLSLYVGPDDQSWADEWLAKNVGPSGFTCLAPTAQWKSKCWPIDRYTEIARRFLSTRVAGDHVIVLAGPNETEQIRPMLDALNQPSQVHHPVTTVGQMMAILNRARLLVCNDSAPLHIAVGLGRPIVALFGPTDPRLVGPYQHEGSVIQPPPTARNGLPSHYRRLRDNQDLIAQISEDQVWDKIVEQLHKRSPTVLRE